MENDSSRLSFQLHDLRSTLSAALFFTELLEIEEPELVDNQSFKSITRSLLAAVQDSHKILDAVVCAAGKTQEADSERSYSLVRAQDALRNDAPAQFAALSERFPVDINYTCTTLEEDKWLLLDREAISSIRQNVIANAANSGASVVNVHYEMRDYCLAITMQDDGDGMSEEQLIKLQLGVRLDEEIHGLGSRSIFSAAADHSAVATYHSDKDQGTTVKILCPYTENEAR